MGKILIIRGADFSKYKVETLKMPYTDPVEIPEISIDSETLLCTLSANENLNIFYTTDGSEPSLDSNYYTEPFEINRITTIKAITHNYKTVSQLPKINVTAKIGYRTGHSLEINSNVSGSIKYTTDGSEPSYSSDEYLEPISISTGDIIKVAIYSDSTLVSEISTIEITN